MNDIFNAYGVTQEQRQAIEAKINEQVQFEKEYMSRPHNKAAGNMELTQEQIKVYEKAGVHPFSVKLNKVEQKEAHHTGRSIPMTTKPSTNPLKKKSVVTPPETQLSPHLNPSQKTAVFAHETAHHALHHVTKWDMLIDSLADLTGKTPAEISYNKHLNKLLTIQEQQADIFHKSPTTAAAMREYRSTGYYPNRLFLGHYQQLSEIDELHKLKDKLENYKPEPMQPKIDTLSTMKLNAPAPLLRSPQRQFPQKPKVFLADQISATAQQLATE